MRKDEQLMSLLADGHNIANFVCFSPDLVVLNSTIPEQTSRSAYIKALRGKAASGKVNIRSFKPDNPNNNPFYMGLDSINEISSILIDLTSKGYYVIVNELIPLDDGGFSGVLIGDYAEVAPGDTPRCVEKPGVMKCDKEFLDHLIYTLYKVDIDEEGGLDADGKRLEFSFHPYKCGVLNKHIITWECSNAISTPVTPPFPIWPNRFSEAMGDKVFGLLVAHYFRYYIPFSQVVSKTLPVFSFGYREYSENYWSRTAPKVNTPGEYPTVRGYLSPFWIHNVDELASMIYQNEIVGEFSGAAICESDDKPTIIEGVTGFGDGFMMGESIGELAEKVKIAVNKTIKSLYRHLEHPIKVEWIYRDGKVFIIQLNLIHNVKTLVSKNDLFDPYYFCLSDYNDREEAWVAFNKMIDRYLSFCSNKTIVIVGDVGITSHYGDTLRKNNINHYFQR